MLDVGQLICDLFIGHSKLGIVIVCLIVGLRSMELIISGFLPVCSSIQFYKEVGVENLLDSSQLGTSTQVIPSYPIPKV